MEPNHYFIFVTERDEKEYFAAFPNPPLPPPRENNQYEVPHLELLADALISNRKVKNELPTDYSKLISFRITYAKPHDTLVGELFGPDTLTSRFSRNLNKTEQKDLERYINGRINWYRQNEMELQKRRAQLANRPC